MECVFAKTEVYEQLGEPIFSLFIHRKFTGFSQKTSFFIELGLFEQKN
jgi:hypothetical protein